MTVFPLPSYISKAVFLINFNIFIKHFIYIHTHTHTHTHTLM